MPAIAAIAINDGKTTPVLHTFSPQTTNGSLAEFLNRSATIQAGMEQLHIEYVKPRSANAAHQYKVKLVRPVTANVSGVDTVVRKSTTTLTMNFGNDSTAADRKDEVALLRNLFTNAGFISAVENLEPYF